MSKQNRFVLVNASQDRYWEEMLEKAMEPLGTLQIVTEEEAVGLAQLDQCDLIVVDASAVDNVPLLLERIAAQQPGMKVIVATASPTWTRAREAFQSGAIDYIRKSIDPEDILSTVHNALKKPRHSSPLVDQESAPWKG